MIEKILSYIAADPLRVLYFLGGSGGFVYWISLWRSRVRVKVHLLDARWAQATSTMGELILFIELENLGDKPTSVSPTLSLSGIDGYRKPRIVELRISEGERTLDAFRPSNLVAKAVIDPGVMIWTFKTVTVRFTRGRDRKIRTRADLNRQISRSRYWLESTIFRIFGRLPFYPQPGVSEM